MKDPSKNQLYGVFTQQRLVELIGHSESERLARLRIEVLMYFLLLHVRLVRLLCLRKEICDLRLCGRVLRLEKGYEALLTLQEHHIVPMASASNRAILVFIKVLSHFRPEYETRQGHVHHP